MNIKLYNFSKRKNSLGRPNQDSGTEVSVVLKSNCSIYTPIFLLSTDNVENYNYLSWNNRYYYITDIVKTNIKDCWELNCNIDVLASYRSEILDTTAFVTFSSSDYNSMLTDPRLSTDPTPSTLDYYIDCFDFYTGGNNGQFILTYLTYASSNVSMAPVGIAVLDADTIKEVGSILMSDNMIDAMQYITQQLGAAKDAIISCKFTPLTSISGSSINLMLGQYGTGLTAKKPFARCIYYSLTVPIPRIYGDFRDTDDFTRLVMFLPAYGYINLNPSDFLDDSSIKVRYILDQFTGELTYIIGGQKGQRVVTNLYSDIPLGSNKTDMLGAISQVVGGGVALAKQDYISGAVGMFNGIVKSMEHNLGVNGTLNGVSGVIGNIDNDDGKIHLIAINRDTTINPDNMLAKYGRPLNEVKNLGDLSGYVQTANASVNTIAPDNIKDEINNYLDGGVYIE